MSKIVSQQFFLLKQYGVNRAAVQVWVHACQFNPSSVLGPSQSNKTHRKTNCQNYNRALHCYITLKGSGHYW